MKILFHASWRPALLLLCGTLGLMLANTLFIFWELLQSSKAPLSKGVQLLLSNFPAIFVVCAPVLLLWPAALFLKQWEALHPDENIPSWHFVSLVLKFGLAICVWVMLVQEKVVPVANQATVQHIQDLMLESGKDDLIFRPQKDIRQMSITQSWFYLNRSPQAGVPTSRDWLDFYNKFSLPFASLAFAFWGLLSARLLQRNWRFFWLKLLSMGTFLPVLVWYFVYSWVYQMAVSEQIAPLLAAAIPFLSVGGVGLLGFALLSPFNPNSRDLSKS